MYKILLKSYRLLPALTLCIAGLSVFIMSDIANAQPVAFKELHIYKAENNNDPFESRFFRVDGAPTLSVYTTVGDIEVLHNPSIRGVQVDLYVKRDFSLWSGSRSLDSYRIILQQNGNEIVASVEDRRHDSRRTSKDVQFSFVVQVPSKGSTNLRTVDGNVTLDGVEGQHFVQNHNGLIKIKNSAGEIRAASSAGNIELEELRGNIHAKTMSGKILSVNNSGETRVRTVSGDINSSGMSGVLVAASVSGNITAGFRDVSRGIYMETVSGNIELNLPGSKGFSITAVGLRYDFESLNKEYSTARIRSQNATVEIREGGIPVNLSSLSGTIRVKEGQ